MMRNGEPYTTEKRTSTKGDGKEATLVAQVRVEETPRDSDCGPGKASGKAPQSGHAVSELDCRDGNKRQQMAVSMWVATMGPPRSIAGSVDLFGSLVGTATDDNRGQNRELRHNPADLRRARAKARTRMVGRRISSSPKIRTP